MNKVESNIKQREFCYSCYRPKTSCMCGYINKIETNTKFVILMHPKEFKKTKNGTGQFTKNSLSNSELFIGINFTNHSRINEIIEDENNHCYLLYPSKSSLNLSNEKILTNKNIVIFIVDSTWACSKKMIRESKNLQKLEMLSFDVKKMSEFKIKKQPNEYCLSTIESTQYIIELLNNYGLENLSIKDLEEMTKPFKKMVEYQIDWMKRREDPRYKTY
ncbi:MAG: DTW domain-containing protein [Campylobacteraceae bacterium]|nr:DTW domain-containing protein [Campylobacteraceae bacterium]